MIRPSSSWRITTRLASHARRRDVSYETSARSGGRLHEHDLVAELLKAADVMAAPPLRMAPIEVVDAEILMGLMAREHVPQGHEQGVLDGDDRLLGTAPRFQAVIQRAVVALLGLDRSPGHLLQGRAQPGGALPGGDRPALPGALVIAGTQPSPGREMRGGGEPAHVHARLGQDG